MRSFTQNGLIFFVILLNMYKNYKISVVIPCHNEEQNIDSVLDAIPSMVDEVIVVDNASTDGTAEVVKKKNVILVKESKLGYGSAYKAGLAKVTGDIIVGLDGDGQHDPEQLLALVHRLVDERYTIVVGTRMSGLERPKNLGWIRFSGNLFFNMIARALFGSGITDTQSGMWALFASELHGVENYSNGMAFSQELKLKMKANGKYAELPITVNERKGFSKLSMKSDGAKNAFYFFKLYFEQLARNFKTSQAISAAIYIIIFGSISYVILSQDYLSGGDDIYFHIKYSYLYRILPWSQIYDFSWLQYTFPKDQFVDLWWLYHFLQTPFTYIKDLLLAAKLSTLTFLLFFLFTFVKTLKALDIKWRPLWVLLLLFGSQSFLFRLTLGRPLTINLIFFLLTFIVIYKQKYKWLVVIAALFLLNNVAVVLLIPMVGLYCVIASISRKKLVAQPLIYVCVGLALGLVLHPFFPDNLYLTFVQIYHTQFTSLLNQVGVGNEVYPYSFYDYLTVNGGLLLLWLVSLGLWTKSKEYMKDREYGWWVIAVSVLVVVLSFKSKRFIEYSIPGSVVAIAYLWQPYLKKISFGNFRRTWLGVWQFKAAFIIFTAALLSFGWWNVRVIHRDIRSSPSVLPIAVAADWLQTNSKPGMIVYNTQWDQFPQLFFWDHTNNYILGMDPTFMYIRDPEIYKKWIAINDEDVGKWGQVQNLHQVIAYDFNASFLLIEDDRNPQLLSYIDASDVEGKYFVKKFSENGVTIYEIK